MAQCRHAYHNVKKPDKWTKVAMVGEGVASFVSDGYWMGGIIDLAFRLDDDGLGLSWYGIGSGAGLSIMIAIGTAYSHTMLNINHQEHEAHIPDETTGLLVNEHGGHTHSHDHRVDAAHHHEEHHHVEHHHENAPEGHLTKLRKLALVGDFISHTGDIAGPLTLVAKMVAKDRLPVWGTVLVQCGATLFGGLSSVANVRTCAKSMREINSQATEKPLLVATHGHTH